MYCETLTYSSMVDMPDEDGISDWDKRTVQYIISNYNKVRRNIKFMGKGLAEYQVDDIASDVVFYFKESPDYDIEKAYNEITDTYISLEGFVNVGIKNCIKRYKTETYKREKNLTSNVILTEDGEKDIFETIPDTSPLDTMENIGYDLEKTLKSIRGIRYRYGIDIYLLIYIRALSNKHVDVYENIIGALGITKRELNNADKRISVEPDMQSLIKAICLSNRQDTIDKIECYIYCCDIIKCAINKIVGHSD